MTRACPSTGRGGCRGESLSPVKPLSVPVAWDEPMTTRRQWSASEKLRIVTELMAPNANVAAICRAHGMHSSQAYEWRRAAQEGMKIALTGAASPDAMLKAENARLKRLVAVQALGLQAYREVLEGSSEGKKDARRSG